MNAVLVYISDAWIGLNDREINNTYVWVSTGKNVTYTNWGQYQPDDVVWAHACVLMDKRKGQWDDKRCSYSRPYICKKDKASPKPTSMTRAKEWSPEVEEAWRFQLAGYRDELDYKNAKNPEGAERWPQNGYVKKLQGRDGQWYYYNKGRELMDKDIPKCILYVY
ncbi:meiosis expressed gene 1 protein homolog [Mercenaria mercenaria]|uniref:meiosis expressed gene 1 protein homolog n=1 Tax=Mercenaria mercenaria TaxID=6596 RepID=UPI00234E82F9|nr:meiosis expressed gene 1 protein homolog [Mercenaria mercenaria]